MKVSVSIGVSLCWHPFLATIQTVWDSKFTMERGPLLVISNFSPKLREQIMIFLK